MMGEVAKLLAPKGEVGYLREEAYTRTVDTLLASPSTPVITKQPTGAWTSVIWDRVKKM